MRRVNSRTSSPSDDMSFSDDKLTLAVINYKSYRAKNKIPYKKIMNLKKQSENSNICGQSFCDEKLTVMWDETYGMTEIARRILTK